MKETSYPDLVAEVLAEDMAIVDEVVREEMKSWPSPGNPEELSGVPWNQWTDQHKQVLLSIYGKTLEDYIAKKAIAQMREHEAEVI